MSSDAEVLGGIVERSVLSLIVAFERHEPKTWGRRWVLQPVVLHEESSLHRSTHKVDSIHLTVRDCQCVMTFDDKVLKYCRSDSSSWHGSDVHHPGFTGINIHTVGPNTIVFELCPVWRLRLFCNYSIWHLNNLFQTKLEFLNWSTNDNVRSFIAYKLTNLINSWWPIAPLPVQAEVIIRTNILAWMCRRQGWRWFSAGTSQGLLTRVPYNQAHGPSVHDSYFGGYVFGRPSN